jgi:hypothetical protein
MSTDSSVTYSLQSLADLCRDRVEDEARAAAARAADEREARRQARIAEEAAAAAELLRRVEAERAREEAEARRRGIEAASQLRSELGTKHAQRMAELEAQHRHERELAILAQGSRAAKLKRLLIGVAACWVASLAVMAFASQSASQSSSTAAAARIAAVEERLTSVHVELAAAQRDGDALRDTERSLRAQLEEERASVPEAPVCAVVDEPAKKKPTTPRYVPPAPKAPDPAPQPQCNDQSGDPCCAFGRIVC